jgi:hypothetical protein
MTGKQIDADQATAELRPLRDLLLLMPHLQVRTEYNIDYESCESALLYQIGSNADTTMRTIHRGIAAIGKLLVYTSPEVGTDEFSADSTEALGFLIAELGDLAATAHIIATSCQRFNADYSPGTPKHIPNARP